MTIRWRLAALAAAAAVLVTTVGGMGTTATPGLAAAEGWRVPVLMYHHVDTALSAHDPVTVSLTVMAQAFEAQLRLLRDAGYRSMSLEDLWAGLARHAPVPPHRVVLTFDDGYEDNYAVVFPLLRRYGFVAAFFVVTSTIGTPGHMTGAQLRAMARAGMEIESHGQHHVDFTRVSQPAARRELARSREIIAGWSGRPVEFFAYPAGRFSPSLEGLLGELGYHGALTEVPGFVTPSSAPFVLERIRVAHDDSSEAFARKLHLPAP